MVAWSAPRRRNDSTNFLVALSDCTAGRVTMDERAFAMLPGDMSLPSLPGSRSYASGDLLEERLCGEVEQPEDLVAGEVAQAPGRRVQRHGAHDPGARPPV